MRPGQVAEIVVDAFPGQTFAGKVESLAPASGAQFALLPPDNATGNFTRIVQRVPVKITFAGEAARAFDARLVPGLSAVVEVKVGG
jgi:membrane fusion protein (multidrug efflux system)